jgi:hypothetical protein
MTAYHMKDLRASLAQISSQGWRADRGRECPRPARATHSEQARRAKNERKIKPNTATTAKPCSAEIARSDALGYYQTQTKLAAAVLSPPKDGRFLTLPDADPCLNRPAQKKKLRLPGPDGYGWCPFTVSYGKIVLAEFGYNITRRDHGW